MGEKFQLTTPETKPSLDFITVNQIHLEILNSGNGAAKAWVLAGEAHTDAGQPDGLFNDVLTRVDFTTAEYEVIRAANAKLFADFRKLFLEEAAKKLKKVGTVV